VSIFRSLYHTMFLKQQRRRHRNAQSQLKAIQSMADKLPIEDQTTCKDAMSWLAKTAGHHLGKSRV